MRLIKFLIGALAGFLLLASSAFAANAAPFGLELGITTADQVKKEVGSKTVLQNMGENKYTAGDMLQANGGAFEVEGLQNVLFIFDKSNVLVGAILTMNKDPRSMVKTLSGKYQLVSNRVDTFMNYGYARFQKGDSFIEIDAPHLSFAMEVRYVTKGLMAKYNQTTTDEKSAKQKQKNSSL